ncbi:MAG: ribonuclease H-like domain-containing protein [Hymenobacteraceae bacterium]|nr:ribonuclease H-like domain-containing protein [Hymenobacteraceae bacterium]
MLRPVDLTRVFFVDIETAPGQADFQNLDPRRQQLWNTFCGRRYPKETEAGKSAADLYANAGIYAEFGQVVCISVGYFRREPDGGLRFYLKSFASADECEVLRGFADALGERRPYGSKLQGATTREPRNPDDAAERRDLGHWLCAHNGREFDYAYLGRRMVICGVSLPPMLDIAGYKPWDLPHLLDTMEMWKFGDNKGGIQLNLLAGLFQIPSPKDDIDGSQVGRVFWEEGEAGVRRIAEYCQRDVETLARVYLHYAGQANLWDPERVVRRPLGAGVAAMRVA